jgi:uncharacterized protein YkwD
MPGLESAPAPRRSPRFSRPPSRVFRFGLLISALLSVAALAIVPAAGATTAGTRTHHSHRARAASGCADANARVGSTPAPALRAAVVCLINQQRERRHLPTLAVSRDLNRSAQSWTNVMVSSGDFTHGLDFANRITAAGFVWRDAGENIATGFPTPRSVVEGWMASTGHCQNILNPGYREVGTGVSPRLVRGFATGPGTWTQDFALGMKQSPPSGNFAPMHGCPY